MGQQTRQRIIFFGQDTERVIDRIRAVAPELGMATLVQMASGPCTIVGSSNEPDVAICLEGWTAGSLPWEDLDPAQDVCVYVPDEEPNSANVSVAMGLGEFWDVFVHLWSPEIGKLLKREGSKVANSTRVIEVGSSLELARILSEATSTLSSVMDAKSMTLHDIAKPLMTLRNSHYMLSREESLSDRGREGVRLGGIALDFIEHLFDEWTPHSQEATEQRECVSLSTVIDFVLTQEKEQISARPIQMIVSSLPDVLGEKQSWNRLLSNILGNAIKYMDPKKPIGRIEVGYRSTSQGVFIFIRDNGIGIPEADSERIHETRCRGTNIEDVNGSGLGLSIANREAALQGGQLRLVSIEGKGTTVAIELPHSRLISEPTLAVERTT